MYICIAAISSFNNEAACTSITYACDFSGKLPKWFVHSLNGAFMSLARGEEEKKC